MPQQHFTDQIIETQKEEETSSEKYFLGAKPRQKLRTSASQASGFSLRSVVFKMWSLDQQH